MSQRNMLNDFHLSQTFIPLPPYLGHSFCLGFVHRVRIAFHVRYSWALRNLPSESDSSHLHPRVFPLLRDDPNIVLSFPHEQRHLQKYSLLPCLLILFPEKLTTSRPPKINPIRFLNFLLSGSSHGIIVEGSVCLGIQVLAEAAPYWGAVFALWW